MYIHVFSITYVRMSDVLSSLCKQTREKLGPDASTGRRVITLSMLNLASQKLRLIVNYTRITSTPQLPFKGPQIPSNGDHKALNGGTLGGAGRCKCRYKYILPAPPRCTINRLLVSI